MVGQEIGGRGVGRGGGGREAKLRSGVTVADFRRARSSRCRLSSFESGAR